MCRIGHRTPVAFLAVSAFCFAQVYAEDDSVDSPQVNYGDTTEERLHIADIRIGSRDADRRGVATYTAPSGFTILGHSIQRSGHHSGVSHRETTQPGRLTYENTAMASLRDVLREGFVKGALTTNTDQGASKSEGSAISEYVDFLRSFDGKYRFVADTHGSISFDWFVDSKSFDHGARLEAHATIKLQKAATAADAERATDIIRFAIQSGESAQAFELMDKALGVPRPSQ